jgi:hypothetical protein
MYRDELETAVLINGATDHTRIDFTPISRALHRQGVNVFPFDLEGDEERDPRLLGGLVSHLIQEGGFVRRRANLTLVTAGPYAASKGLDIAESSHVKGIALLAPNLPPDDLPRLKRLLGGGLEVVVVQPVFGNGSKLEPEKTLIAMLGEDMYTPRGEPSMRRVTITSDVRAAVAGLAKRLTTRRGGFRSPAA